MKPSRLLAVAVIVVLGVFGDSNANADLVVGDAVGIDFDATNNGGTDPLASLNFNHFNDIGIADGATASLGGSIFDTDGGVWAGVGFSATNNTGDNTNEANSGQGDPFGGFDTTIYGDRLISNDSNATGRITDGDTVIDGTNDRAHFVLRFSGLNDALTYDLLGGHHTDNGNSNFDTIWQVAQPGGVISSATNFEHAFTGLVTDGAGNLEIYVIRQSNANGRHVTISGLTLTAIPEPGSLTVLGLGCLFVMGRRRK